MVLPSSLVEYKNNYKGHWFQPNEKRNFSRRESHRYFKRKANYLRITLTIFEQTCKIPQQHVKYHHYIQNTTKKMKEILLP